MKFKFEIAAALVVAGMTIPTAEAHEFWIDGKVIDQDGTSKLTLDLKVGQMLDAISLPYIPETVERFEWVHGGTGDISGKIGEIPAAFVPLDPSEGAVIFHRTTVRRLVHRDWAKFLEYLAMEGLGGIAEAHDLRDLPRTGFVETYTRHAKFALVDPASKDIDDRYVGSPIEIVLDQVRMKDGDLSINGRVVSIPSDETRQVSVFYGSPEGPKVHRLRSDPDGMFSVVIPGTGPVLLNVVKMSAASTAEADWHSDWASTFLSLR